MNQHEFQVCCAILDDCRRLIAAGKVQRWDVVKWAVTVNLALATASIALTSVRGGILALSMFVAVVAALVVLYYNDRMTKTRNDSVGIEKYLMNNDVNFKAITGKEPEEVGFWYDLEDLLIFAVILVLSIGPAFVLYQWPQISGGMRALS